jgi:hypothetical protein
MKKIVTILSTVLLVVLMLTGVGQALPIQGAIWEPADSSAEDPSLGPPANVGPKATFTVDSLDFDSQRTTITYDTWLKGATSGNPNGLVWLTDPTNIKNSFYTSTEHGTFFQFIGTAYFSANVVITHDDGFWLNLGGTVYDFSTPTTPISTTLNNQAGTYAFTLNYGAWNGFPEVLQVPDSSAVPEPTTMLLLGLGLVGIAGVRRKFKK